MEKIWRPQIPWRWGLLGSMCHSEVQNTNIYCGLFLTLSSEGRQHSGCLLQNLKMTSLMFIMFYIVAHDPRKFIYAVLPFYYRLKIAFFVDYLISANLFFSFFLIIYNCLCVLFPWFSCMKNCCERIIHMHQHFLI